MHENIKLDLGSVKVHRHVLEQIVERSIKDINGAYLLRPAVLDRLKAALGFNGHPGVKLRSDDNKELHLEIAIKIDYGVNVQDVARKIQDIIKLDIKKSLDIGIKDINIEIEGIEGG